LYSDYIFTNTVTGAYANRSFRVTAYLNYKQKFSADITDNSLPISCQGSLFNAVQADN
jgi:hypothetical protein